MWTPRGTNKLLFTKQSPYQTISLYQNGNHYWLGLNNVIQFHTAECYRSHEYMCRYPLMMARRPEKVLIIGGGDGFAAREFCKYPFIKQITNVELDGDLVNLTKSHPIMRMLTNDSFNNPRVNLIVGDGIGYLLNSPERYDIIIDDCEYEYTGQPGGREEKRYKAYLKALTGKLNPGGIACLMEPLIRVKPLATKYLGHHALNQGRLFLTRDGDVIVKDFTDRLRNQLQQDFLESDEFEFWKKTAPHLAVSTHMSKIIGPEIYIYMSNEPIVMRRKV